MKTNMKRLLALILALSMVMSLLSVNVWAADTSADGSGDVSIVQNEGDGSTPDETPDKSDEEAPEEAPEETPNETPDKSPEEAPAEAPEETKTPTEEGKTRADKSVKAAKSLSAAKGALRTQGDPVTYLQASWDSAKKEVKLEEKSTSTYTTVDSSTTSFADNTWYVVNSNVTISNRITVNGTVNLILCDGAKLTASKGITTTDATLNIYEGWTGDRAETHTVGQLVISGVEDYNAAIGGLGNTSASSTGGAGGSVNIHGGTVTANGGSFAAGIGGGGGMRSGGSGGTVTIHGGTLTATGGYGAAGIGGGFLGAGANVTINGGTVTATGGDDAAGIGGGFGGDGGSVTFASGMAAKESADNSTWTDVSGTSASKRYVKVYPIPTPIPYLAWDDTQKKLVNQTGDNACTDYTVVTSGTTAFEDGKWYVVNAPSADNLTITDRITVSGTANLILMDGAKLTASKGITVAEGNTLNIYEGWTGDSRAANPTVGELVATGHGSYNYTAGIGGGSGGSGGTVAIHGGVVTATGSSYSAGIGGGGDVSNTGGSGGTVIINGGTVTATGGYRAAGIGGAYEDGSGASVTINGGTVTAIGGDSTVAIGACFASSNSGALSLGTGMYLYGGRSAKPEDDLSNNVKLIDGNYRRDKYMTVNNVVPHIHSFTYTVTSDTTITATCSADDCPLPEVDGRHTATLTIATPTNLAYDGTAKAVTITDENSIQGKATVSYYNADTSGNKTGEALTAAPTAVGRYWAEITLGTGDNSATAHVAYEIAAGKDMTASLTVEGSGGTAVLLNNDYTTIDGGTVSKKAGEQFLLCVTPKDEYDFAFSSGGDVIMTEFTSAEYEAYLDYVEDHNEAAKLNEQIAVSPNTVLYRVTMPSTESGNVTMTVTFAKPKTYTVLYQPQNNSGAVFCKIATEQQGGEVVKYAMMSSGAKLGDNTVWSLTITSAFDPKKVAFVGANTPADEPATKNLMDTLQDAAMSTATVTQTANYAWNNITGGQYLIIGGTAKVVTAVFVSDPSAMTVFQDNAFDEATTTTGATYQFAVCANGSAGTVTAPTAPTMEGFDFGGWRGVEGTAPHEKEKVYNAGDSISISENTIINAVWNPVKPTITLDLNKGSMSGETPTSVDYNTKLNLSETPKRSGYAFDCWTVNKPVTENGVYYGRGSTFDLNTPITADLELTAQWKHVHSYSCYQFSDFGSKLEKYLKYESALHVAICGCGDIQIEAHSFDSKGWCACGYGKPDAEVTLNTSYGLWSGGNYTEKMVGFPETATKGSEVSVCAPAYWGNNEFSRWQYSTDNTHWHDLTADSYCSFLIPATMSVRALYINPVTVPTVELSSRNYEDQTEYKGHTYKMDNILYQMNYKLPDGCTFVDGGIKMGDNSGISYYFIQQVKMSYDKESKGIIAGLGAGLAVATFFTDGIFDAVSNFNDVAGHMNDTGITYNYLETEDNVLETMDAATLAKYMYEGKPINVEKYPPIYWGANVQTKGMSGSIATIAPLRFAQKNNQEHYIYGIAWMRYKQNGQIKTIYTNAIDPTVNQPNRSASKSGS